MTRRPSYDLVLALLRPHVRFRPDDDTAPAPVLLLLPLLPRPTTQNSTVAISSAAHEPQAKPNAHAPSDASRPSARKALRALTKVALFRVRNVSINIPRVGGGGGGGNKRHQRNGHTPKKQRHARHQPRDGAAQTPAAREEAREEGRRLKEERDQVHDGAEAPEVPVRRARGAAAVGADERRRGTDRVGAGPGGAKGEGRRRGAAVEVVSAADAEVGPLGEVARAGDARGVGGEEEGRGEGGGVGYAGEDDEPEEHEGAGEEDYGDEAEA